MKDVQITITIKIKDDGKIEVDANAIPALPDDENDAAAGINSECTEITEAEEERQTIVSDLANICEYLTDSEVIKIRLIISKAEKRR